MRILILHLSDIHFEGDRSLAERLSNGLPAAVRGILDQPTQIVLAISGDIAFSGKRDEYSRAGAFLDQLLKNLEGLSGSTVKEVLVPGNHDCDFSGSQAVRDLVLKEARTLADNHQPLDRALIEISLSPQAAFFEFASARGNPVAPDQRINYQRSLTFDTFTVAFNCINTAWGSQLHERQAQLVLPLPALTEPQSDGIVISLFHHPFNWFSADNGRALRATLEKWSDVILTGHEHAGAGYLKHSDDGTRTVYSAGNVLETSNGAASGFNAVVIDTTSKTYRVLRHEWKDDLYTPVIADPPWFAFARDLRGRVGKFRSTDEFAAFLSDAGAAFSHPARADLRLADIFIYPDLRRLNYDKGDPPVGRFIAGDSVPAFIISRPTHLILGDEKAGKTSLAKSLYLELQRRRFVPLLLKGSECLRYKKGKLQAIVDSAVIRQYGGDVVEHYRQLEPRLKAILVDDVDQARLTKAQQHALAAELERVAGTIVLLASQDYQLDTMTQRPGEEDALLKYTRSSIMELGFKLRGRLIEKWVNLGEPAATDEEIARVIGGIEQTVTGLLGRNLLPSFPLFVLIILQSYEAQNVLRTTAGSLGYYYEILIFTVLQGKTALITFDTLMTLVASIAYWLLQHKKKWLTGEELEELTDRYEKEYKVRVPRETLRKVLTDARILKPAGDKTLRFNYRYVYCYFAAKFIATNLNSSALAARG
jgi:predicted MPP superfamily phosphohydrolase